MDLRPKDISFDFLQPKKRAITIGNRGRRLGVMNFKTKQRNKAIANLPIIHYIAKQSQEQGQVIMSNVNKSSAISQEICKMLKKEVDSVDWEQKRILAVHAYYYFKNCGIDNFLAQAASLYNVSESFVRKWKHLFKEKGEIAPYTKWGHNSKYITLFDHEDKILAAKKYVRECTIPKGEIAMSTEKFANYCTDFLLVDCIPKQRRISNETARRWLHLLGFE